MIGPIKTKVSDLIASARDGVLRVSSSKKMKVLVNNDFILEKLRKSFETEKKRLSIKNRRVMYKTCFIIILHESIFQELSGTFPGVVKSALEDFYASLKKDNDNGAQIEFVSKEWTFEFVSCPGNYDGNLITEFDLVIVNSTVRIKRARKNDKLDMTLTAKETASVSKEYPEKMLKNIKFFNIGVFEVPFNSNLVLEEAVESQERKKDQAYGELTVKVFASDLPEAIYLMKEKEIIIARKNEKTQSLPNCITIDSEWVGVFHARIRYSERKRCFQIASFCGEGKQTRVDDEIIPESPSLDPIWISIKDQCTIFLSEMVSIYFEGTLPELH